MFVIPLNFYDFLLQGEKVAVYPALSMPLVGFQVFPVHHIASKSCKL
jgi:hypothetical protein